MRTDPNVPSKMRAHGSVLKINKRVFFLESFEKQRQSIPNVCRNDIKRNNKIRYGMLEINCKA